MISRCAVYDKNTAPIDVDLSVSEFLQQGTKKRLVCLVDAREQADVERLKQHFVDMVSHDIRTPLGAIKAFLTVVEEDVYGKLSETRPKCCAAVTSIGRCVASPN